MTSEVTAKPVVQRTIEKKWSYDIYYSSVFFYLFLNLLYLDHVSAVFRCNALLWAVSLLLLRWITSPSIQGGPLEMSIMKLCYLNKINMYSYASTDIGYLHKMHKILKSYEISFFQNIEFCYIILKMCTKHGIFCAKFQNDSTAEQ